MRNELRIFAKEASAQSYSPYSKAKVGSAVRTKDGQIYSGCNVENASFGGTVCAERVAIWKAVSEGHRELSEIYVYTHDGWPPCGMCLQVMTEFSDGELLITFADHKGVETTKKLKDMLTNAFTPKHME
jgi:cytidine deaminase